VLPAIACTSEAPSSSPDFAAASLKAKKPKNHDHEKPGDAFEL
jgi:hypothetical protein